MWSLSAKVGGVARQTYKRGVQTSKGPEERNYCLEVGGRVKGLGRGEGNLSGGGLGSAGMDLDVTVLENQ